MVTPAEETDRYGQVVTALRCQALRTRLGAIHEALLECYFSLLGGHRRTVRNPSNGYTILMPVVPQFYPITEFNLASCCRATWRIATN